MYQSIPKPPMIPFNEAGLVLDQISHCMERNSSDTPGVCPGKGECGLGSFGIDWYIKKDAKCYSWNFWKLFEYLLNLQISDFVTNNQWVPVKKTKKKNKKESPKLKMLGPLFNKTVLKSEDRLQNSVLQYAEMKLWSFYFKVQQRLKDICVIKQQP